MIFVENSRVFAILCKLVFIMRIISIEFNPYSNQVKLLSPNSSTSRWIFNIETMLIVVLIFQYFQKKDVTSIENVIALILWVVILCCILHIHQLRTKATDVVLLINGLFQFDIMYPNPMDNQGKMSLRRKINVAFIHCCAISAVLIPLGIAYGLPLLNPCLKSSAFYWTLPECTAEAKVTQDTTAIGLITKCVVLLINHWMWATASHGGFYPLPVLHTMATIALQQFTRR